MSSGSKQFRKKHRAEKHARAGDREGNYIIKVLRKTKQKGYRGVPRNT